VRTNLNVSIEYNRFSQDSPSCRGGKGSYLRVCILEGRYLMEAVRRSRYQHGKVTFRYLYPLN
jgi:hypothetical protein